MRLIQLMIAGAAKAATTTLLHSLGQHPGVCIHPQREIGYFAVDSEYALGYKNALDRYFPCSQQVPNPSLFAKNVMIMYLPEAMKRLHAHNSSVHIVLSLRHPVDRAYSDFWYARRRGWENLDSFEAAIAASSTRFANDLARQRSCSYLDRSTYIKHLLRLLTCFDEEQVHIFLLEDIKCDLVGVCQKLYTLFDELDARFVPELNQHRNVAATARFQSLAELMSSRSKLSSLKSVIRQVMPNQVVDKLRDTAQRANERQFTPPPISAETRERLLHYFRPFNAELADLLKRDLSHWNS